MLACAWIVAFFPVLSNTTLGLQSVDRNLLELFDLYGATRPRWAPAFVGRFLSRLKALWYLRRPAALPYFLAGLKIAGGLSLIGAVVAEIAAGSAGAGSGLAYRIVESQYRLNIPRLFAALGLLSVTGIVIFLALSALSHLLLRRWHESALVGGAVMPTGFAAIPDAPALPARQRPRAAAAHHDAPASPPDRDGLAPDRPHRRGRPHRLDRRRGHLHPRHGPARPRPRRRPRPAAPRRPPHPSRQGPYLAAPPQPGRHLRERARERRRRPGGVLDGRRRARPHGFRASAAPSPTAPARSAPISIPIGKQTAITWPVFAEMREAYADRIALQGVALFPLDTVLDGPDEFRDVVATTARHGGVLGGVTFTGRAPDARTDAALDRLMQAAGANGLDLDLHVDESDSPEARTLERVADAALRNRFAGKILCGHCCSAALMGEARARSAPAQARRGADRGGQPAALQHVPAGPASPAAPRAGGAWRRCTRWPGVGIPVAVASDNTRDPFYAYGDLDMLEVFREATRILHLDHSGPDWVRAVAATPADLMGLDRHGRLEAGDPADLVLTRARSLNELWSRPQTDRTVLRRAAVRSTRRLRTTASSTRS